MQFRKSLRATGSLPAIIQIDPVNGNVQFQIPQGNLYGMRYVPVSVSWWAVGQPQTYQFAEVNPFANVSELDTESGLIQLITIRQHPDDDYIPEGVALKDSSQWFDWDDVFLNTDPLGNPVTPPKPGDDVFIAAKLYSAEMYESKPIGTIAQQ